MTTTLDGVIRRALKLRPDIWLDDEGNVYAADGCPGIQGVQLCRTKETAILGADSYHPYTRISWIYHGQSFAIETEIIKGKNPLSKSQLEWRADFEACGGLYIEARSLSDVYDVLGKSRPEPWDEYLTRLTRIK